MKRICVLFALLAALSAAAFADALVDVVKMKDGNTYKGVILENKINEYVIIELAGGSQFRLKYADIDSITREASPGSSAAAQGQQIIIQQNQSQSQQAQTSGDIGQDAPIKFIGRQSLFTLPYYSYRGGQFTLDSWGSGYLGLVEAVEASVTPSVELKTLIAEYKSQIETAKTLFWGGLIVELVGAGWMIANEVDYLSRTTYSSFSTSDLLSTLALPGGVMFGGAIASIVGGVQAAKEPTKVVAYYNSNYTK